MNHIFGYNGYSLVQTKAIKNDTSLQMQPFIQTFHKAT